MWRSLIEIEQLPDADMINEMVFAGQQAGITMKTNAAAIIAQFGRWGFVPGAGATGPAGPTGPTGVAGATGPTGATGTISAVPSTPARVLGTAFQPSATRPTLCIYTIQIVANSTIASGTAGSVSLLSDATTNPTTPICAVSSGMSAGLALSLNLTNTQSSPLVFLCPAGNYVKLVSSGTATVTLSSQCEVTL